MESSQKISLRFQSRPPPPPPGGVIFQDGFESGSSSAWTEVDGEGDLNVTAAAALNGTFGLAALIDNTTVMYVLDNSPTNEARYRARFYFDPNAITMTMGDLHNIMVALNAGVPPPWRASRVLAL